MTNKTALRKMEAILRQLEALDDAMPRGSVAGTIAALRHDMCTPRYYITLEDEQRAWLRERKNG